MADQMADPIDDLDLRQLKDLLMAELTYSHALKEAARSVLRGFEEKDKACIAEGLRGLKILLAV